MVVSTWVYQAGVIRLSDKEKAHVFSVQGNLSRHEMFSCIIDHNYHTKPKDGQSQAVHALQSHTGSMLYSGGSGVRANSPNYNCGRMGPLEQLARHAGGQAMISPAALGHPRHVRWPIPIGACCRRWCRRPMQSLASARPANT